MTQSTTLILASSSSRRQQLLREAGYQFEIVSPAIVEATSAFLSLRELTTLNAMRKALATAREHAGHILAADTLVALDGEIIGKPNDLAHAAEILLRLSGRTHEVCSAVAIISSAGKRIHFRVISRVRFRKLDRQMIDGYFQKINPLDKAGAYAAQGCGSEIIAQIEGSYTNVVGLPMEETTSALGRIGILPKET